MQGATGNIWGKKKERVDLDCFRPNCKRFFFLHSLSLEMLHIGDGAFGDNGQRGGWPCKMRRALEFNAFGEGI